MAFCPWGDLSMYIKSHGQLPSMPAQPAAANPVYSSAELTASVVTNSTLMATSADPLTAINAVWDDVKNFPASPGGGLNPWVVRSFLYQLCSALEFMWDMQIVHRDIKPQNLLLQPAGSEFLASGHPLGIPQIKVADFGFARHLPAASLAETLCGSPLYMAPEILRRERYGAKADLWSVGAVTYEMATGKPPFNAVNYLELLRRIEENGDRIRFPDERSDRSISRENARRLQGNLSPYEHPPAIPNDLKSILRSLLKRRAAERASFDELFRSDAVASGSGPQLARALGRPLRSSVSGFCVLPPSNANSPSPRHMDMSFTRTVTLSPRAFSASMSPQITAAVPAAVTCSTSSPTVAAPDTETLLSPAYPPARSRAMPISGSSPCPRPQARLSVISSSLPPSEMPRQRSPSQGSPASGVFGAPAFLHTGTPNSPTSLPKVKSGPSAIQEQLSPPTLARKTTVGFTPLTALPSPRNRAVSLAAYSSGEFIPNPHCRPSRVSSDETSQGSSGGAISIATLEGQSATQPRFSSGGCDTDVPLSARHAHEASGDASEQSLRSSLTCHGAGCAEKGLSRRRLAGEDALLDGEYAMVDDGPARAVGEDDAFAAFPGIAGTFNPSPTQSAANAARAAAVSALGASPIRRLSQIRSSSFAKLGGAVLSGFPSPRAQPQPHSASPASHPDQAIRPLSTASPVPPLLRVRTMSAAEPRMDNSGTSAPNLQLRMLPSSQSRTQGDCSGRTSRHASVSGPTMPCSAPRTPAQPITFASKMKGESRRLSVPHCPALALAPHQRPPSFHRRSYTSFSGSGYSPRFGQALVPALVAGRTVSPVASSSSPVPCSPISLRCGSRARSLTREAQAWGGPGRRLSTGQYETSLPPPSTLQSPKLDSSPGGLSIGGNASLHRGAPPSPIGGSSLSRALSKAAARLQSTPTGTGPLRNAQALVRAEHRGQSVPTTLGLGATGAAAGVSLDSSVSHGAFTALDPGEQKILTTLQSLDKKALVLAELGNYLLNPRGTLGPSAPDGDGRGLSPWPGAGHAHRHSVGSGRSSSSLSFASGTAGERDSCTPGTTPSSTPFNSGSVFSAFPAYPPLAPISDVEAVAAECLLIYVRAASLVERALNEARFFIDACKFSHPSRAACPELMESMYLWQFLFEPLADPSVLLWQRPNYCNAASARFTTRSRRLKPGLAMEMF